MKSWPKNDEMKNSNQKVQSAVINALPQVFRFQAKLILCHLPF
jgi:hypothetical protein